MAESQQGNTVPGTQGHAETTPVEIVWKEMFSNVLQN